MNKPPLQAKRRSLADLVAVQAPPAIAPVEHAEQGTPASAPAALITPAGRAKYPSATVYLPSRALRLIKEIGLEENRRISDIIATAVDEYLQKRGHPALKELASLP